MAVSVSGGEQTGKACRLYFSELNENKTAVETKRSLRKKKREVKLKESLV